jgi:hypothetical protein
MRQANLFVELIRSFTQMAKAFLARRAAIDELAACDVSEVARVAQDLGISPADLCALAARDRTAADLLNRRLATLRVNPISADPVLMRDLQRCCSSCDSKQLCVHELEDRPQIASWPKYCPNKETIAHLANGGAQQER